MKNYFVTSIKRSLVFLAVTAVLFMLVIRFFSGPSKELDKMPKSRIYGRMLNYSVDWQKDTSDIYFQGKPVQRELKYTIPKSMISAYFACTQVPRIARLRHSSTDVLLRLVNSKVVTEHLGGYDIEMVNVGDLNLTLDSLYPMYNAR